MTTLKVHRPTPRSRKKNSIPLSKLRTSEVVRTVVDHPRRLEELINLLQDKERSFRGRASATLAQLSQSHPARLLKHMERLRDALADDSAYVRWHMLYTLGHVIARFPRRAAYSLPDISARLTDDDKVVRRFACRALEDVAVRNPQLVQQLFSANKDALPPSVAYVLQGGGKKDGRPKTW